jgi:DNA-binding PadR family transcriptional regulator
MGRRRDSEIKILTAIEEDVLTLLAVHSRAMYGLELLEYINRANEKTNRSELSQGVLYLVLSRMEAQGFTTTFNEVGGETVQKKRRYNIISSEGKIALKTTQQYRHYLLQIC